MGGVVIRRQLRRAQVLPFFAKLPACLIGIEACATGHYWARELGALGHQVKLIPPSYVKPYVKRQKNDAADAEAICEAVTRPTMRLVEVKSPEQQSVMVLHRVRLTFMRQRIQLSNTIRGYMAEFGLVAPIRREGLQQLIRLVEDRDPRVPDEARICLEFLVAQLQLVNLQILETDRRVRTSARSTEVGRRLMSIPGVGPLLASALVATVAKPTAFKSCQRAPKFPRMWASKIPYLAGLWFWGLAGVVIGLGPPWRSSAAFGRRRRRNEGFRANMLGNEVGVLA